MDSEPFIRWALDDARTLEERYTTELLVERGVSHWNAQRKIYRTESIEESIERKRQRTLNPAYEPHYTGEALRRAFEGWLNIKNLWFDTGYRERPVRDFGALRFFTWVEELQGGFGNEVNDLAPLAELPRLRLLHLQNAKCMDYRPLAKCKGLKELHLGMGRNWPQVDGVAALPQLEILKLRGNLLLFEGAVFPHVLSAVIECEPLPTRSVRGLPQLPRCQFLHLAGAETLEGIEAFGEVRNLTLGTPVESFEPLGALQKLTCLTVLEHEPTDLTPLVRVPRLQFLSLDTWNRTRIQPVKPRDVSVLVDSSSLRELHVRGSTIIETEAGAVQAGLPSWDDLLLRPEPRPLPPLKMRALPYRQLPRGQIVPPPPGEPEIDIGLHKCEFRWAQRQLHRAISRKLGTKDWGVANAEHETISHPSPQALQARHRQLDVEFHAFALLDKYPLFIEAIRECLARLVPEYQVHIWNQLKAPRPDPTPAQRELQEKFEREQDHADFEQLVQDTQEYMDRLHRYELKKQEGAKVDPAEFAPEPRTESPEAPWEEDEDDDEDAADDGDIAVKEKPDPPPAYLDDEHPLADNYALIAELTLDTFWIPVRQRGVAEYLMNRVCDDVIEEPKQES